MRDNFRLQLKFSRSTNNSQSNLNEFKRDERSKQNSSNANYLDNLVRSLLYIVRKIFFYYSPFWFWMCILKTILWWTVYLFMFFYSPIYIIINTRYLHRTLKCSCSVNMFSLNIPWSGYKIAPIRWYRCKVASGRCST